MYFIKSTKIDFRSFLLTLNQHQDRMKSFNFHLYHTPKSKFKRRVNQKLLVSVRNVKNSITAYCCYQPRCVRCWQDHQLADYSHAHDTPLKCVIYTIIIQSIRRVGRLTNNSDIKINPISMILIKYKISNIDRIDIFNVFVKYMQYIILKIH